MNDTDETTESRETADDVTHPEMISGVSSETTETVPESGAPTPGKRLPRGGWRWFAVAAVLVFVGLLCMRNEVKAAALSASIVEKARELEKAGNHEKAGYYWRNAVEHASDGELLSVLGEYAEAFFKAKTEDSEARYAEAATLERLAELALVRVPPEKMDAAFALRDKCAKFRSDFFAATAVLPEDEPAEADEPELAPGTVVRSVADSVAKLLAELETEVAGYEPGSGSDGSASEPECRILQLSGVAESAMSQLWFLDRSGLDAAEKNRIGAFPKSLADTIEKFDEKHDAPLLADIQRLAGSKPPRTDSDAPHQRKIEFYTTQYANATAKARMLRGTNALAKAQESMSGILKKVADEKRQQMNEYQKFVANCCKLAFDSWNTMHTGGAGFGYVPKKKTESVDHFINHHIRQFAQRLPLGTLRTETQPSKIYVNDNLIAGALDRDTDPRPSMWDVKNEHKAFIITAIYGFYRIDQSLLTPETSRLFNDVFGKYYEKMDSTRKTWSVRWMVEEPKIRLEDF